MPYQRPESPQQWPESPNEQFKVIEAEIPECGFAGNYQRLKDTRTWLKERSMTYKFETLLGYFQKTEERLAKAYTMLSDPMLTIDSLYEDERMEAPRIVAEVEELLEKHRQAMLWYFHDEGLDTKAIIAKYDSKGFLRGGIRGPRPERPETTADRLRKLVRERQQREAEEQDIKSMPPPPKLSRPQEHAAGPIAAPPPPKPKAPGPIAAPRPPKRRASDVVEDNDVTDTFFKFCTS